MPIHTWGDEWFKQYGDDLDAAMDYIRVYVRRWSKCQACMKEKYGTIRYEWVLPQTIFSWESKLYILHQKWGYKVLYRAIKKATKKWPEIKEEIESDAPFEEYYNKYWTTD